MKHILPGKTIGILGGGQLGRMVALKAREMGYRIVTLDPNADSPCGQVADVELVGPLDQLDIARQLASRADVITYEFENVSDEMLHILETESYLPQGSELLRITRHRIREKQALEAIGVPVANWHSVSTYEELVRAVEELRIPSVLKTATGGYDGKGQYVIRKPEDLRTAWEQISSLYEDTNRVELVLETWVRFEKEISVIAARGVNGELRTFPIAENMHRENILHESIVPARISESLAEEAAELAKRIAEKYQLIGLLAVEMFVADGKLLVNELAPRPHNSGHYTIDACVTSQFEQHVRAVCGLPLGDTRLLTPVVMVNLLGEHMEPLYQRMEHIGDDVKLHVYGKHDAKRKRKMGHINILAPTVDQALVKVEQLGIW